MKDKDGERDGFRRKRGKGKSNEGDLVRYEGTGQYEYYAVWLCDVERRERKEIKRV